MRLSELKNKRVLILGFGKEGKDSYLALRKLFPKKILGIADQMEFSIFLNSEGITRSEATGSYFQFSNLIRKDKHLKLYLGENYLKALKNYDLIIKTPGISLKTIKPFLGKKAKVTSQTEIFFENCPAKIVGVTGTKGKGTTASLIYEILKKRGLKAHLIGNIGKPVFQTLLKAKPTDIFVYELSSHQLQNLKKSPQIAVFLNLYPAHLDYYKNFQEYQKAKENIAKWQTKKDYFIYNSEQKELKEIAKKTKAKKIPIKLTNGNTFPGNIDVAGERTEHAAGEGECRLIGKFNLFNVMAAVKVGELFNVPKKKIKQAIKSFKPLPHRLEFVGKYKGVEFYNDSLATVPQAVEAGLSALGSKVKTLILGGSDKENFDFSNLAKKILKSNIKNLIFLSPGTGERIWQEIVKLRENLDNLPENFFVFSMPEAIKVAYKRTGKGSICLLSPGSPSFNLFRDYRQRGNLFKKFVKMYGSRK